MFFIPVKNSNNTQERIAMKIISKLATIDTTNKMTVAFDVSKKTLNYYTEIEGKISGTNHKETIGGQGEIKNTTSAITHELKNLIEESHNHGYDGIHIVCEPTGIYSDCLMRTAHRLNCTTAYINGESVSKAKVIENNDSGKDDIKDPRIIHLLASIGKELTYRQLPPEYQALRELNRMYDSASADRAEAKALIQTLILKLFYDFPMSKDFIFDKSGKTLMETFHFSPYRIAETTLEDFTIKMVKVNPCIRKSTLKKLFECANQSKLHCIDPKVLEVLEKHLQTVWDDYITADNRKFKIGQDIINIYNYLRNNNELMPLEDKKVFTPLTIGRLLGESGPLKDFPNWQALLKYAGLNLRKRESGTVKGKLKISKKGRAPFRGVLGKLVFGLIRKNQIFGEYYHARKSPEKVGTRIMAVLERKLLKMFFALSRKNEAFDKNRLHVCESQFAIAA
jgi:hypothetical protein